MTIISFVLPTNPALTHKQEHPRNVIHEVIEMDMSVLYK